MLELSTQQIRNYRLYAHHLDRYYQDIDLIEVVGACGLQNTPPNAWETALYNRIPDLSVNEMHQLLYEEKTLLQAWSYRGLPVIFPTSMSQIYLSAFNAKNGEEWIYTKGIQLALDALQMDFNDVLHRLLHVLPKLDHQIILSKNSLDETLALWMLESLSDNQKEIWIKPSMYGSLDKQTIGGAVVSFLLRPSSLLGLVVFGERKDGSPTFTSYKNWIGSSLKSNEEASKQLIRKYLHCYGPTTCNSFIKWSGCSTIQGHRLWDNVADEMIEVKAAGKRAFMLEADKEYIKSISYPQRRYLLLGGHDPYLDQRDREILQQDKAYHKQIWQMVSNPGALIDNGEIIGIWKSKKKKTGLVIDIKVWKEADKSQIVELAEQYAVFRNQRLVSIDIE